jgi:signal transduction histidine kinase
VNRVWELLRAHGVDALIVVAAVESALEVASSSGPLEATTDNWFAVPAAALIVLPLLFRRRFPFIAPAALWLLAAAISFVDGRLVTSTASAVVAGVGAAFLLGNLREAAQARLGLAIAVGGGAIIVYNDPTHAAGDLLVTPMLFAIGWLAGYALRERATQAEAAEMRAAIAEREREAAARVAVAEERARIARELHDIVAHSVSVMVLQVGAVRHNLPSARDEDRDALDSVERTGRTALAEMRRLLGAMRREDDDVALAPQPGLGALDGLVEQVGRAGLPVVLRVEGDVERLPDGLEVSAYRIVQEGLTNALKHAHASQADVTIRFGSDDLYVEVRDDGPGAAGTAYENGSGHGLVGVRERVKIYGGEMSAFRPDSGGFVLSARLPLHREMS